MTDNEIIKALECCKDGKILICLRCTFIENCYAEDYTENHLFRDALDLINRQQAEIEELKARQDEKLKLTTL